MSDEWTNTQILECSSDDGEMLTGFRQTNGTNQRYVLGNGQTVEYNTDGTFTVPGRETNLSILSF